MKNIGKNVYKDLMSLKEDLANESKILLAQAKGVYSEVLSFLSKKDFPEEDSSFYKKPLYDEI